MTRERTERFTVPKQIDFPVHINPGGTHQENSGEIQLTNSLSLEFETGKEEVRIRFSSAQNTFGKLGIIRLETVPEGTSQKVAKSADKKREWLVFPLQRTDNNRWSWEFSVKVKRGEVLHVYSYEQLIEAECLEHPVFARAFIETSRRTGISQLHKWAGPVENYLMRMPQPIRRELQANGSGKAKTT